MRNRHILTTALMAVTLTAGCASLGMDLPFIDDAAIAAEKDRARLAAFQRYKDDNKRLQSLAAPILVANAPLCEKRRTALPLQTAKLTAFPKPLRALAKNAYGYTGKEPRIIYGPDDLIGGEIIGPKGQTISAQSADETSQITGKPAKRLPPKPSLQCDYPVILKYTPAINAYANGRSITVTTGMMDFASDEELGLIIGHELAHNTQGHVRKIVQNTIIGFGRGTFARQFESEADYVGLYYSARAGYDISNVSDFWRRLALESVKHLDAPKTHPVSSERYVRLRAALSEIRAKQSSGKNLEPNKK